MKAPEDFPRLFTKADKEQEWKKDERGRGRISQSEEEDPEREIIYSVARQDKWISSATVN